MTIITAPSSSPSRTTPIAAHAFRVPVVRELPARAVDMRDASAW